ncbi:MAG: monooxygenase [Polyangiaceae bacterium]|nr:monooxygenase [Polyangiaceae bacterium]
MSERRVGPILVDGAIARAIACAIESESDEVVVVDRGGYLRVSSRSPCSASRISIEDRLGAPFCMRRDLEPVMPSYSGRLELDDEVVRWR